MPLKAIENRFRTSFLNKSLLQPFSAAEIEKVNQFHKTHESYSRSPLRQLNSLAARLEIDALLVKDESNRMGLNAFKILGASYAAGSILASLTGREADTPGLTELKPEAYGPQTGRITFITATDGNHGRSVARAARQLGQKSIVYLPKNASPHRADSIRKEGATVTISDLNYDDTVQLCRKKALEHDYVLLQDTAFDDYTQIPLLIMQGYTTIVNEIKLELAEQQIKAPTHIFLQAGVGSFAASITAAFKQLFPGEEQKIFIIEPDRADCYYRSFAEYNGQIRMVRGALNSVMAGLCCGEPNTIAFDILKQYTHTFYSCSDDLASLGVSLFENPVDPDPKITSDYSGAVPLGVVSWLLTQKDRKLAGEIGLNKQSRVLIINTEGKTRAP